MAVAITAILVAMAANALTGSRKVARVAGEAWLIVQRLQATRTNAVSQGASQGYSHRRQRSGAVGPDRQHRLRLLEAEPHRPGGELQPIARPEGSVRRALCR